MRLNFKRIDGVGDLPKRATEFTAGYDLFSPRYVVIKPGEQELIKLGITWDPDIWTAETAGLLSRVNHFVTIKVGGFFAKIFDKSGLALKQRFNTRAGVIDMDYPKEWGLICVNEGKEDVVFNQNDKLAQFVLLPFLLADDLEGVDLGSRTGGFGSTGR